MKNFRKIGLLLALMLIVVSIVACTPKKGPEKDIVDEGNKDKVEDIVEETSKYPIEVEDSFGNKATIEKEPMTIVSLAPNNTEVLFALGLGNKVIGVTTYCDYPEEAASKEIIGDYSGNNLEKIVELNPDLVLAYGPGDEEENKILRDAGIIVLGFLPETIGSVIQDIETVGKITGKDKEASEIVKSMMDKKDEILEKVKDLEGLKVFYEIWHDPLMAAGKGSFMDQLITLAGGTNIAEDADGAYPTYDLEQLVEKNPDIFLGAQDTPDKTVESVKIRPGFESIEAIKNNRIYIFEGNEANLVSRPGPRIIDALELIAKSIHPEAFK